MLNLYDEHFLLNDVIIINNDYDLMKMILANKYISMPLFFQNMVSNSRSVLLTSLVLCSSLNITKTYFHENERC